MATIVLQAAGAFLGGVFGPVGSAIGSAVGAMAGYTLDRALIDSTRRIEGPRLNAMRPFVAEEGASVPRIYGTMRIGGNLIWATRFEEARKTERQGGKGGPKVTTYSYFGNAAFVLCEGPIAGVRRIWADGRELNLGQHSIRVHHGTEDQLVDPLIEAKQSEANAPAYRGVAYVVFERFALAEYGNRLPQFQFEVLRPVGALREAIGAVAMLPGSTEYGLAAQPVTRSTGSGETEQVNRNVLHGETDLTASLDELQTVCPNVEDIALVVTWFGNDLRAGQCTIRPAVVESGGGFSHEWSVSDVSRADAVTVSRVDGAAAYGGTPADWTVVEAIREIRARGLKVTLYPFVMMDIAADNALPDPYGDGIQPAYPWRGRIACDPAPGQAGTADKTEAARDQVTAFCGSVAPEDFAGAEASVAYSGAAEDWGYRRLILHYAHLAAAAGGVDGFLLGSELRGLTTLRDGTGAFPFVEALCQLAGEVRAVLGPQAEITYGADWSEYFGHQPADGSGDVLFHLDALWAHEAVTSVGIDNYMPLSDWRDADHGGGNPDGFAEPYDPAGLRSQISGGEGFDWYYASLADRIARVRTPISDGAYDKPWTFRTKDIKGWWSNQHFDRPGGVEAASPTAWVPRSKPIRFTELGCPAVDKGPNQPNVFPDPKSVESALPYFSSGGRSDVAQARFLAAHASWWSASDDPAALEERNPLSPVYGGRMVDFSRAHIWAWDARPFPAFPALGGLWADGANWQTGHWLNGRLSTVSVSDLIGEILSDHGLAGDARAAGGTVAGYLVADPTTARAALEPLVDLFGIAVSEDAGTLRFSDKAASSGEAVTVPDLVLDRNDATVERIRLPEDSAPSEAELGFLDPFNDYQSAVARVVHWQDGERVAQTLAFPGSLEKGAAESLLSDWLRRRWNARETIGFALPPAAIAIGPGALIRLPEEAGETEFLVGQVEEGLARRIRGHRILRRPMTPWRTGREHIAMRPMIAGAPHVAFLDLPLGPAGGAPEDRFRVAAYAKPWQSQIVYVSPEDAGFVQTATVTLPATMGRLVEDVTGGFEGRLDLAGTMLVELFAGELESVSLPRLLNGANRAAILSSSGQWEVFQFAAAEEIAPSHWRLSQLLRGQAGTNDAMAAGAPAGATFVLLNSGEVPAGLAPGQTGLTLNWKIGPIGHDLTSGSFTSHRETGGIRAHLPLSPVHLRAEREAGGAVRLSWIRRGRVDADSWLAEDIPLGEEEESYRVEVGPPGGASVRSVTVSEPVWTYQAAEIAADFGGAPDAIEVSVRQISARVGAGVAATRQFDIT